MNEYMEVLQKYFLFEGRARRREYWMFTLVNIIIYVALTLASYAVHVPYLAGLYSLAVLIPGLGVSARRLHDVGKSGWWLLLNLIPLIGAIIIIVWAAKDGDPGSNMYGQNPKEVTPPQTQTPAV